MSEGEAADTQRLEWIMSRSKVEFHFEEVGGVYVEAYFDGNEFDCPKMDVAGWYRAYGETPRECIDRLINAHGNTMVVWNPGGRHQDGCVVRIMCQG